MMRFNASLASATPTARQGYLAGEYPQGITTKNGIPCKARILVTEASTYRAVASTVTSESGTWLVAGLDTERRYNVIARDIAQEYSDVVAVRVRPTTLQTIAVAGEFTSNAAFNGVAGEIDLVGGLPPYTMSVQTPLPHGLTAVADGHKVLIDGSSDDPGVWDSTVRASASNGPFVDIPVRALIGLAGPPVVAVYAADADWEIALKFPGVAAFAEGVHVYRSTEPMDAGALPAPIATLAASAAEYVDSDVLPGQTYYYRIAVFLGAESSLSAETVRTAVWTPGDLPVAPQLWLDWDSEITLVAGAVTSWTNKGSLGGSFYQSTASNAPGVAAGPAGRRALRFNGSNTYLDSAAGSGLARNTDRTTVLMIGQLRTKSSLGCVLGINTAGGARARLNIGYGYPTATGLYLASSRRDAVDPEAVASAEVPADAWAILICDHKFAEDRLSLGFNGSAVASVSPAWNYSAITSDTPSSFPAAIGRYPSGGNHMDGDLAAVVGIDGPISERDVQRLEGWAAHACGLQSHLPADHPYKTTAP
ncbi:hypothetical protein [Delftia acidovorans]|uniref:hypothetical protein n=1 Tax=Delftia acidovorans TaxID=80866 RepID=UPI00192CC3E2|nr:hypothetical protein [Delftia acidovorans]